MFWIKSALIVALIICFTSINTTDAKGGRGGGGGGRGGSRGGGSRGKSSGGKSSGGGGGFWGGLFGSSKSSSSSSSSSSKSSDSSSSGYKSKSSDSSNYYGHHHTRNRATPPSYKNYHPHHNTGYNQGNNYYYNNNNNPNSVYNNRHQYFEKPKPENQIISHLGAAAGGAYLSHKYNNLVNGYHYGQYNRQHYHNNYYHNRHTDSSSYASENNADTADSTNNEIPAKINYEDRTYSPPPVVPFVVGYGIAEAPEIHNLRDEADKTYGNDTDKEAILKAAEVNNFLLSKLRPKSSEIVSNSLVTTTTTTTTTVAPPPTTTNFMHYHNELMKDMLARNPDLKQYLPAYGIGLDESTTSSSTTPEPAQGPKVAPLVIQDLPYDHLIPQQPNGSKSSTCFSTSALSILLLLLCLLFGK